MKYIILLISFFAFAQMANAQTKSKTTTRSKAHYKKAKKANPSVFVCPMHPDQRSGKPAKCAVCGMDMKNKNYKKKAGKNQSQVYYCPMKCEGDKTYAREGSCPVCKMDLSKKSMK